MKGIKPVAPEKIEIEHRHKSETKTTYGSYFSSEIQFQEKKTFSPISF